MPQCNCPWRDFQQTLERLSLLYFLHSQPFGSSLQRSSFSARLPDMLNRHRPIDPTPLRGLATTDQNNNDLILKENYNQAF